MSSLFLFLPISMSMGTENNGFISFSVDLLSEGKPNMFVQCCCIGDYIFEHNYNNPLQAAIRKWVQGFLKYCYRNDLINIMKILYLFAIVALLGICQAAQDVPIQKGGYGFSVGDPYGTLHIEFFIDFQCPDSKASFNTWTNVRKAISLVKNNVKLTYQFNPLPYHLYSARIHQAFFYVLDQAGPTAAEEFIAYVFDKIEEFSQDANLNKTGEQFDREFSLRIANIFGVDAGQLEKELGLGTQSFTVNKFHWKYTTITKGVPGAPLFFANGVLVDGAEEYSYSDWINFIEKYKK